MALQINLKYKFIDEPTDEWAYANVHIYECVHTYVNVFFLMYMYVYGCVYGCVCKYEVLIFTVTEKNDSLVEIINFDCTTIKSKIRSYKRIAMGVCWE